MDQKRNKEKNRQEALLYYIGGKVYNPKHDRREVESLNNLGYLSWHLTDGAEEYYETTAAGLIRLRSCGYDVPAPEVCGCMIVDDGRDDRLVDWDPSVLKGSNQDVQGSGKSAFRSRSGWFKRNLGKATRVWRT